MSKWLKVTLKQSAISRGHTQKETLRGLGLRRRHQIRILKESPQVWGMIKKVIHLVDAETVGSKAEKKVETPKTYKLGAVVEIKKKAKTPKTKNIASDSEAKASKGKNVKEKSPKAKKSPEVKKTKKIVLEKKKSSKK
jgi:large subunit ribosomal protein L30